MTLLSAPLQELARTRPQRTQLHLSIFQPRAVFKARVNNGSATRGDRTIPYDSVTLGSIADIESGMTLWVGTTEGSKDVGKIRIRSVNGSAFTISENSNIPWSDNLYLTVVRYWELWSIYPRIINDPSDIENVIFYKDYDIPYSNQNSILGTFPCAGSHQALFRGEQVYWSSTGTFNPLGDTLSFEWAFEGGTPTGSTLRDPGLVTYNTPGQFATRLMISGSSGMNDSTYRYVSVYDRPGQGSNTPIKKWAVSSIGGSRDEGGYRATFTVFEDVPIDENSVVILFSEDWYGSTKQSIGGNSPGNERIFFVGYVTRDTIRYNYQDSSVSFEVGSLTEIMKEALGFSVSVESKANPATWYELKDMDCRRAIYHYLKWHTTAMSIADFQFLGSDYKIQFFDADRASMYDAIDNLLRNTLIGKVVSDRQGKVWMEVDAKAYSNPTGSFSAAMEITKRDWMGEPVIQEEFSDRLSYLEMGGIAYSGVNTGTFSALLACAPGSAPSFRGSIDMPEGLALLSQSQLNQLVGNLFANTNSRLPKIDMDMANNFSNLDLAPQQSAKMTILESDTVRGIPVDGLYLPDEIQWRYDPKNQILLPEISFINLVSGPAGETVGIPESITDAGFDLGGFSVPQLQIPPLPILTIPPSLAAAVGNVISTGQYTQFMNDYGSAVYRFANLGFSYYLRGITVQTASVVANAVEIELALDESGIYIVLAHVTNFAPTGNGFDEVVVSQNGSTKYRNGNSGGSGNNVGVSVGGVIVGAGGDIIALTNSPTASCTAVLEASLTLVKISN